MTATNHGSAIPAASPAQEATPPRYDVKAQERVVAALWAFARALGHTENVHDSVRPALTEIMDAFGHNIVSIE
jgi:hypothetical protein